MPAVTDTSEARLVVLGVDADIAALCVAAGLTTPRLLKASEVEDLPEGAAEDSVISTWRAQ